MTRECDDAKRGHVFQEVGDPRGIKTEYLLNGFAHFCRLDIMSIPAFLKVRFVEIIRDVNYQYILIMKSYFVVILCRSE